MDGYVLLHKLVIAHVDPDRHSSDIVFGLVHSIQLTILDPLHLPSFLNLSKIN